MTDTMERIRVIEDFLCNTCGWQRGTHPKGQRILRGVFEDGNRVGIMLKPARTPGWIYADLFVGGNEAAQMQAWIDRPSWRFRWVETCPAEHRGAVAFMVNMLMPGIQPYRIEVSSPDSDVMGELTMFNGHAVLDPPGPPAIEA